MQRPGEPARKMVVFDMDNTLLQNRFIEACAEKFNFKQALSLLRQIDHDQVSLTQRIAYFLKGKKRSELLSIADDIPLVPDIHEVIRQLRDRSYIIGIISDSYHVITEKVAKMIKADFELANELQFVGDHVTGEVLIPSYFHYSGESSCKHQVCKTNALRFICRTYSTQLENCIVVGDSDNDACMLKHAGLGVAFCTTSELLKSVAKKHIEKRAFSDLLTYAW
jgi:glucosyl-3-phosphoglycerate synthase